MCMTQFNSAKSNNFHQNRLFPLFDVLINILSIYNGFIFLSFFSSRQKQLNEQNFDYILSWQENFNPLNSAHFMESNAFTANEMMMTHSNRRPNMQPDGTGVGAQQSNKSKKPHTVLLRRRHSLPEIIMRK